jgi:acyl carrier protein
MNESFTLENVYSKIRKKTAEVMKVDEALITPETRFVEDLGAESLDIVTLIIEFEDEFKETIPDEDIEGLKTVRDVGSFIMERFAAKDHA